MLSAKHRLHASADRFTAQRPRSRDRLSKHAVLTDGPLPQVLDCSGAGSWTCFPDASGGKLVSCNFGLLGAPAAQAAYVVSKPRAEGGALALDRLRVKTLWSTLDTLAPPVRLGLQPLNVP